jgi:hypothetical protein
MKQSPLIHPTGVDGRTGQLLTPSLTLAELVARLRQAGSGSTTLEIDTAVRRNGEALAPPFLTDPGNLKETGWGVIFGASVSQEIKDRLRPLLDHRKAGTNPRYYHELVASKGESAQVFLTRNGVQAGAVKPHKVPYYLLIVASPEEVSWELQYHLDIEYAVGRLWFDDDGGEQRAAERFETYAKAVIAYEQERAAARPRKLALWGPQHQGDGATQMSSSMLLKPLRDGQDGMPSMAVRVTSTAPETCFEGDATRDRLVQLIGGGAAQPALLFTAGHGVKYPLGDQEQFARQGALLTGDCKSLPSTQPEHALAASDIAKMGEAFDGRGLVAFFFACYGAGTPERDTFALAGMGDPLAPRPFVARLPQALLGHPTRPVLAVAGHVDRAWGYSFWPEGLTEPQVDHFDAFIGRVLHGECAGHATTDIHARAAVLSSQLANALTPGSPVQMTDHDLAWTFVERNDARNYVLLGDPAVRLR